MKKIIGTFAFIFLLTACDQSVDIEYPVVDPDGFLDQTIPLQDTSKRLMEGVYEVVKGMNTSATAWS